MLDFSSNAVSGTRFRGFNYISGVESKVWRVLGRRGFFLVAVRMALL